jgi:hypothetical protein
MIDICTVVFRQEIAALKVQAESIARYASNLGTRNIYVVVNDTDDLVAEIDATWWGSLADRVMVVPRSAFSTDWCNNGWVSQQALKLLCSAMSYNQYVMVLDAKTIVVRDFELAAITNNGRPRVGTMAIFPVFRPSADIAGALWDITVTQQLGPGGVPYFFHTATVRAMIADCEQRTKHSFPAWFQAQGMLTEFVLYSAWLQQQNLYDTLYADPAIIPCNVDHSEVNRIDSRLDEMQRIKPHTVSIHRGAWQHMTPDQRMRYQHYLIDQGLTSAWQL